MSDRLLAGLKQSRVFRGLGDASLESIAVVGSVVDLGAGEIIIAEG